MNKTKVESGIKMANEIEKRERQFLGLPMVLIWGYIAVAYLYDRRRYGASIFI